MFVFGYEIVADYDKKTAFFTVQYFGEQYGL